ncbi:MAG: sensor domain-containing diguanylate cyclase [Pseudomonadota bacterium]
MQTPATPIDEADRLTDLQQLNVLDTEAEERFDRFTRLAQHMFSVPIALVSLVDANRQWFMSRQGLDACETGRDISFCGHAVLQDQPLVIEDTLEDPRFHDNPLVTDAPHIRFYAGAPVRGPAGHQIGTLCLIDRVPRTFSQQDVNALTDIAALVSNELNAVQMAMTDELTGLSNRRGFDLLTDQAMAMCARNRQRSSMIAIDMNGFKRINDAHGHAEGDAALKAFAAILLRTFRESDVLARVGGDEFSVLLTGTEEPEAQIAIDRLYLAVHDYNASSGKPYKLCFSAGLACCVPGRSFADALAQADEKMYLAKQNRTAAGDSWAI